MNNNRQVTDTRTRDKREGSLSGVALGTSVHKAHIAIDTPRFFHAVIESITLQIRQAVVASATCQLRNVQIASAVGPPPISASRGRHCTIHR